MPTKYMDKEPAEQERATAYHSAPKEENFEKKVNCLDDYLNLKDDEKTYIPTQMHISKEREKENIKTAYGDLVFSYSTNRKDHAYEEFAVCLDQSGHPIESGLSDGSLAKTGLMIKEPEDKAPVLTKDIVMKLCDLVKYNQKSIESGEYELTLKEKFVSFVKLIGYSTIVNDNEHSVRTDIYACYANSQYENKDLSVKLNSSQIEGKGIVYSSQFYDNAKKAFDEARAIRDNLLDLASEDNSKIAQLFLITSILVIIAVFNGLMIASSILSTFLAPLSAGLAIITTILSVGLEMASLMLLSLNIYALVKAFEHKAAVKNLLNCDSFKALDSQVKKYEKMYDNKDTFLMSPLSVVQPSVSYFKNLYQQNDYQQLVKDAETLRADKKTFDYEVDRISKIIGFISAGITAALFACLIVALIKQAKATEAAAEEQQKAELLAREMENYS